VARERYLRRMARSHPPAERGSIAKAGHWVVRGSREVVRNRWLTLRADDCVTARGVEVSPYYVLEVPDFVHVVAFDREGSLVLVRQYRHGLGLESLELPGGTIDPQDRDPVAAAVRELREETGFVGEHAELLASLTVDPARYSNRLHLVVVRGAVKRSEPSPDASEELEVLVLPAEQALRLAMTGGILNAAHVGLLAIALSKA
jgi:8-oxo-dGTP pyrophosphatase MutT (NUDIX family)